MFDLWSNIVSAWQEHLAKEMTNRYHTLHTNARKVVDDANTEIGELQKQLECKCHLRIASNVTDINIALNIEKKEAERRTEEVAMMYKDKSKRCETLSHLYETLKSKVQAEQTRGAAAISAEHTLQSMGSGSMPEIRMQRKQRHMQPKSMSGSPAIKMTPSKLRHVTDQNGIELLHPHQRSGSATGVQTSSEIRAATSGMTAHMHQRGRQSATRHSTSTTPAHRITLNRPTASQVFPHSTTRASMSEHFTTQTMDRFPFEGQNASRNDQFPSRKPILTPNMHSRMPANRGLY